VKSKILIRILESYDLQSITAVHLASFPEAALSKLGAGSVKRYYDWQLTGPHDVVPLGAFQESHLCGFCIGGVFRGATGGFIRRHRMYLLFRVVTHPWLIANPLFRERINLAVAILTQKKRAIARSDATRDHKLADYGILSIAVHPSFQRAGVGRLLMDRSEAIARLNGFQTMSLTVHPENYHAISFYHSLGWVKYERDDCWRGAMVKML
jgi:ribosomal protein S18 acetylase RimI-like enzyme